MNRLRVQGGNLFEKNNSVRTYVQNSRADSYIWFSKLFYSANIKKEDHNDSKYSILVNTPNGR